MGYDETDNSNISSSSLNEWDLWALRAGVLVFGSYCTSFILNPFIKKVFVDKSGGLLETIQKHLRFFILASYGLIIGPFFLFYDMMPHRAWFTFISLVIGLFALTETYISYKRLPFILFSPLRTEVTNIIIIVQTSVMIIRTILDGIMFIFIFTGPHSEAFYIFMKILRIISGVFFSISEFWVSKITMDVIATPRKDLTADMKLQLKDTKLKLHQLMMANYLGGITAIVDIANHWVELQITQAFVIFIGAGTYIYYGTLFRLGLERDDDNIQETYSSGHSHSTTPQPVESATHSSSVRSSNSSA